MISKELQQAKEAIAEDNSYKLFGALCSPSVLLVAALAGVGLVIPGWFIYRTINYQLTRDKCLEFVRKDTGGEADRERQYDLMMEIAGVGRAQLTIEICSYFK